MQASNPIVIMLIMNVFFQQRGPFFEEYTVGERVLGVKHSLENITTPRKSIFTPTFRNQ